MLDDEPVDDIFTVQSYFGTIDSKTSKLKSVAAAATHKKQQQQQLKRQLKQQMKQQKKDNGRRRNNTISTIINGTTISGMSDGPISEAIETNQNRYVLS